MELRRIPSGSGDRQLMEIIETVNRSYVGCGAVKPVTVEYTYDCLSLEYEVRMFDCPLGTLRELAGECGYTVEIDGEAAIIRSGNQKGGNR